LRLYIEHTTMAQKAGDMLANAGKFIKNLNKLNEETNDKKSNNDRNKGVVRETLEWIRRKVGYRRR